LDDLKEKTGYSKLKEEALDCTLWRIHFGRGNGPVVRQEYLNSAWQHYVIAERHWTSLQLCIVFIQLQDKVCLRLQSSGTLSNVLWYTDTKVWDECAAYIFIVILNKELAGSSKNPGTPLEHHSLTSCKTVIAIFTAMRTSN